MSSDVLVTYLSGRSTPPQRTMLGLLNYNRGDASVSNPGILAVDLPT